MLDKTKLVSTSQMIANLKVQQTKNQIDEALLHWRPGGVIRIRVESMPPEMRDEILSAYRSRANWIVSHEAGPDDGMFIFR